MRGIVDSVLDMDLEIVVAAFGDANLIPPAFVNAFSPAIAPLRLEL